VHSTRSRGASDKVYQLLAHGRWFSPGTPASSTTKTGRHDIAEIVLKVALKHQKSISQSNMLSRALLEWLYWSCSHRPLKKPTMCRCLETLRKKSFEDTKVVIRSPKIGKNMLFWRKIVIFHTKYPNNFRAPLRSAQFFKCSLLPNLNSWICP
jgi:hypothetical protein